MGSLVQHVLSLYASVSTWNTPIDLTVERKKERKKESSKQWQVGDEKNYGERRSISINSGKPCPWFSHLPNWKLSFGSSFSRYALNLSYLSTCIAPGLADIAMEISSRRKSFGLCQVLVNYCQNGWSILLWNHLINTGCHWSFLGAQFVLCPLTTVVGQGNTSQTSWKRK